MKTIIATAALTLMVLGAVAQNKANYWVVESNSSSKESTVKIYDANNTLVKEHNVARRIDITKKKERRMLNKMMQESSNDWIARRNKAVAGPSKE